MNHRISRTRIFHKVPSRLQWLIAYIGFLSLVSISAYSYGLPRWLDIIPFYDTIGHFVLMGILGILTLLVLKRTIRIKLDISVALAPIVISLISIADEYLQKLSPHRTFSYLDMAANLIGIWAFYFIYRFYAKSKRVKEESL